MQVYVVGEVGIIEELDLKGIQHIGGPEDADKKIELKPGFALPHDESVSPLTATVLFHSKRANVVLMQFCALSCLEWHIPPSRSMPAGILLIIYNALKTSALCLSLQHCAQREWPSFQDP